MATILTLLVLLPFVRKPFRIFVVCYASLLLAAAEIRQVLVDLTLMGSGKEFFEYYSGVQFLFMIGAAILLTGWQRLATMVLFLSFATYNILLCWYWTYIPTTYYDYVSEGLLFLVISFVTSDEKPLSREGLLAFVMSIIIYYTSSIYI
jgi:hypothetical protein